MITALLCCLVLPGAVVHVNPTAPSDGSGAADKPLRSVERAMAVAQPGDTIKLAAGNHALTGTLVIPVAQLTVEGGFDVAFKERQPFTTPSWVMPATGVDRVVLEVPQSAAGLTLDGVSIDGGNTLSYSRTGLTEGSLSRTAPLIRILRGMDITLRNCTLINAPSHAISISVATFVTIQNNVLLGSRVSAITAWGSRHDARVTIQDNTILATWAERLDGTRGDGVDLQSFVTAIVARNLISSAQGVCIRAGRGLTTPVLTANVMGNCRGGTLLAYPNAGPPVSSALQSLEASTLVDARGNRGLAVEPALAEVISDVTAAKRDGGPTPYATRIPAGTKVAGLLKDAGAQPFLAP